MNLRYAGRLMLVAASLAALVGCAPAATPVPAAPTEGAKTMRVAMVTSGPTNDHGWHQNALEGLQSIEKELGYEIAYSESVESAQQQNTLRQYAQQGYDLIYCHGYEWGEALKAVAPDFPNVMFVQINATTEGANIVGTNFKFGELGYFAGIGYFAGMAAGMMTENNKIGIVAAQDAPQVTADSDTIKLGALAVNPDADVNVSFVGSWDDVVKGQQVTQAQIDRGVDVLLIIGDAFAPPAIELARSKGIKVIGGWSGDAHDLAPDTVITSAVQDVPGVYLSIARQRSRASLGPARSRAAPPS